jgi:hypothetical protein
MSKNTKPKKTTAKPKEKKDEDYYTPEEEKKLDWFHEQTENKFTDEEVYKLMKQYKDDDDAILNELKEELKERKRGDFEWKEVGKRNYIIYNIIFN